MPNPIPTQKQIAAALDDFSSFLFATTNLAESTVLNYVGVVKRAIPKIGVRPKEASVLKYFGDMRKGSSGHAHVTVTAVGLERYMASLGKTIHLGRPSKPKTAEKEPLGEVDIGIMIRSAPDIRQRALLSVLAFSGVRNLELCQMNIEDVDLANQNLLVRAGTGNKDRIVNIAGSCVSILSQYLQQRINYNVASRRLFLTHRRKLDLEPQDIRKLQ